MATQYAFGKIVTSGLVLSLNAADRNSYPGSGTTWTDMSGNGNDGTLTNGPTFSSANGGSIVFDGVDDYVIIPNFKNTYSFNTPFTISTFINPLTIIGDRDLISTYTASLNDGVFLEVITNGVVRFCYRNLGTSIFDFSSSLSILTNNYYNITATYNGTNAYLYFNSILQQPSVSATTLFSVAGSDLFVGRLDSSLGRYFYGNISNTLIYNRALSAQEILQNYNAQKSRFGL